MPIISSTICKLVSEDKDSVANEEEECENVTPLDDNACLNVVSEKDKFRFFVNYRGKATEKLANDFKRLNAPCKVIMTTKKVKTVIFRSDPFEKKIRKEKLSKPPSKENLDSKHRNEH